MRFYFNHIVLNSENNTVFDSLKGGDVMVKTRRITAMVFAAIVLLSMIFSLFIIVSEADHDCTGDSCPVCDVIVSCQDTLKALGASFGTSAIAYALLFFIAPFSSLSLILLFTETPVSLKVKLLN